MDVIFESCHIDFVDEIESHQNLLNLSAKLRMNTLLDDTQGCPHIGTLTLDIGMDAVSSIEIHHGFDITYQSNIQVFPDEHWLDCATYVYNPEAYPVLATDQVRHPPEDPELTQYCNTVPELEGVIGMFEASYQLYLAHVSKLLKSFPNKEAEQDEAELDD